MLSAARISDLTDELGVNVGKKHFIINQVKDGQQEALEKAAKEYRMELIGTIPEDSSIREFDLAGKPTIELDSNSLAFNMAFEIFDNILSDLK
jgi:CO dehydrogenase nickel-insertion accessory protein CooC1